MMVSWFYTLLMDAGNHAMTLECKSPSINLISRKGITASTYVYHLVATTYRTPIDGDMAAM